MTPQERAIDAVFRKLGVDLIVDPDGAAEPTLKAIPEGVSEDLSFSGREIRTDGGGIFVRKSDLPHLQNGVLVEFNGQRREIRGEPSYTDRYRFAALLNSVSR